MTPRSPQKYNVSKQSHHSQAIKRPTKERLQQIKQQILKRLTYTERLKVNSRVINTPTENIPIDLNQFKSPQSAANSVRTAQSPPQKSISSFISSTPSPYSQPPSSSTAQTTSPIYRSQPSQSQIQPPEPKTLITVRDYFS
jgi:hypothetical protein